MSGTQQVLEHCLWMNEKLHESPQSREAAGLGRRCARTGHRAQLARGRLHLTAAVWRERVGDGRPLAPRTWGAVLSRQRHCVAARLGEPSLACHGTRPPPCPPLPGTRDSGRPLGTSPLCPCFRHSFSPKLSKPASASFPSGLPLRSLDRVAPVSWPPQMLLPLCGTGLSSRRCPRAVLRHPSGTQCTGARRASTPSHTHCFVFLRASR